MVETPSEPVKLTLRVTRDLTSEFFENVESRRAEAPRPRPIPAPTPLPLALGSRFQIWKQDPSVNQMGRRLSYIPSLVLNGPSDSRFKTECTSPVIRNATGDFIFPEGSAEADCAHTFAVARQTLTMYERRRGGQACPWVWNRGGNTEFLKIFPRGFMGANAFYSRNQKLISFGFFTPSGATGPVYTCRSLDIVSHETGHAILDGLKPGWLGAGNPPQTGGLHEAFGDLTAIFLALSQLDQVEAFISMTKADLHKKSFLDRLAEEFGSAIGRDMGLRNADNDLKLSDVSNEVHAISQVFTGGIYDVLADIFTFEMYRQRSTKDPAQVLLEVNQHLCKLVLDAYMQAPDIGATYTDVVNKMLAISHFQGDPAIYRTFIRNRFSFREVVVSAAPLMAMASGKIDISNPAFVDGEDTISMASAMPEHASLVAPQDRSGCCGTMQLPEYTQEQHTLDANLQKLRQEGTYIPEHEIYAEETEQLSRAFR